MSILSSTKTGAANTPITMKYLTDNGYNTFIKRKGSNLVVSKDNKHYLVVKKVSERNANELQFRFYLNITTVDYNVPMLNLVWDRGMGRYIRDRKNVRKVSQVRVETLADLIFVEKIWRTDNPRKKQALKKKFYKEKTTAIINCKI